MHPGAGAPVVVQPLPHVGKLLVVDHGAQRDGVVPARGVWRVGLWQPRQIGGPPCHTREAAAPQLLLFIRCQRNAIVEILCTPRAASVRGFDTVAAAVTKRTRALREACTLAAVHSFALLTSKGPAARSGGMRSAATAPDKVWPQGRAERSVSQTEPDSLCSATEVWWGWQGGRPVGLRLLTQQAMTECKAHQSNSRSGGPGAHLERT